MSGPLPDLESIARSKCRLVGPVEEGHSRSKRPPKAPLAMLRCGGPVAVNVRRRVAATDVVEHQGACLSRCPDLGPHGVAAAQQAPVEALGLRLGRAGRRRRPAAAAARLLHHRGGVKTRQPEVDAVVDPRRGRGPEARGVARGEALGVARLVAGRAPSRRGGPPARRWRRRGPAAAAGAPAD